MLEGGAELEEVARGQRRLNEVRRLATAADGDGDGSAFDMGSNNGNDAAIADEVRHGRTAPFSARATAAAKRNLFGFKTK